jgi:intracellular sulfur oxidation DsrE/DsrF family protein
MLKSIKSLAIVGMAVAMFGLSGLASAEVAKSTHPIKVVYHVNDVADATNAMRNANNHLEADPTVKITFVTHSKGIDFLLEGAKDKNGNPYNIDVERLMDKGVTFDVCNNTLVKRKIDPKTVLPGAKIVPSGVAEVARLQADEGFVYIKP